MLDGKKLNEYKNKKIVLLIKLSKYFDVFINFAIGVIQFILVTKFAPIYLYDLIEESFEDTFELDTILKLFKDERIVFVLFGFSTLISLIFMYDAAIFVVQKIPKIQRGNGCLMLLTLPYQTFYYFFKINAIFKNNLSLGEFCWDGSYFITKTSRFILNLFLKLFGFSLNCVCLNFILKVKSKLEIANSSVNSSVNSKEFVYISKLEIANSSVNSSVNSKEFVYMRDHLIANIVLYLVEIIIIVLYFKFCTLYNPIPEEKLDKRHGGFMRLEELGSSPCLADKQCGLTDLEHILKSHTYVHKPWRKCNPCYLLTCRKNFFVGFHQTNQSAALGIAKTGFRLGKGFLFLTIWNFF